MSLLASPSSTGHATSTPVRRPRRPAPARLLHTDASEARSRSLVRRRAAWRRQALRDIPAWASVTTSLGFLIVAFMANMDAYVDGVPLPAVMKVMVLSTLAGATGATIILVKRWPR